MMFLAHIAFSLIVAVFIAGCALIAWSQRETASKTLLKVAGYIAVVLSISNVLCLGYYSVRYLNQSSGMGMMKMMPGKEMMECPMMKGGMMNGNNPSAPNTPAPDSNSNGDAADSEDHEAHH